MEKIAETSSSRGVCGLSVKERETEKELNETNF